MKLKAQLFFISLLTLTLPWAGCQSMKEIARVMAENQQAVVTSTLEAAGVMLENRKADIPLQHAMTLGSALYAVQGQDIIVLDARDNDWQQPGSPPLTFSNVGDSLSIRAQIRDKHLYLMIDVEKSTDILSYHPGSNRYDQFWITGLSKNNQATTFLLRSEGNGPFNLLRKTSTNKLVASYPGWWRQQNQKASIEVKLPRGMFMHGINVAWKRPEKPVKLGTKNTFRPIFFQNNALDEALSSLVKQGLDIYLTDQSGWLLGKARGTSVNRDMAGFWLMEKVYAFLLGNEDLPEWQPLFYQGKLVYPNFIAGVEKATWFKDGRRRHLLLSHKITLPGQENAYYLIATQRGEVLVRLAASAFNRLFFISLTVLFVTIAGLLGYASWLSWRIKSLSQSAKLQMQDDTTFEPLPQLQASDEIGSLARDFTELLQNKQQQTDYLTDLAGKLSHELRTPLAVIKTSLDNLKQTDSSDEQGQYIARASDGCTRLSQIFSSMSEARRLEQSIEDYEVEMVPIADMLDELCRVYQQTWPESLFRVCIAMADRETLLSISPELIVQALDKLIDNAVDFAASDTYIEIGMTRSDRFAHISVFNQGAHLEAGLETRLFGSMVSARNKPSDKVHLGLGLHIVSLVARHHNGSVKALNEEMGVKFTISLPLIAEG